MGKLKSGWLDAPAPAYVAERLGTYVRIADAEARETVVYVGLEANGSFAPRGTGFVVGVKHNDFNFNFIVTADHVLDLVPGDHFWVRWNTKAGLAGQPVRFEKNRKIVVPAEWDLAVIPLGGMPLDGLLLRAILLDWASFEKTLKEIWSPELGDDVTTIGLFTSHHGQTKNIPVVRVGNIAMLPDEPVRTTRGYLKAYLVEVRSIMGLSGSPVFLNVPPMRGDRGQVEILEGPRGPLIGVMLGYFLVGSAEDQIIVPQMQGDDFADKEPSMDERNTGFAIVLPVQNLYELLESDVMRKAFDAAIADHLKKAPYRQAGAVVPAKNAPPSTDARASRGNARRSDTRLETA